MRARKNALAAALPATALLSVLFILPILFVAVSGFKQDGTKFYVKFFSDPYYRDILITTVLTALRVTFFALLLGYPTAYFIARSTSKYKNVFLIMTVFPFLVSAIVRAYGWQVLLGDTGVLNQILLGIGLVKKPVKILYTMTGVTIGLVHLLIPYMILSIAGVIQNIPRNLEAAAESLGANRLTVWRKVILPLSLPGVITGCILVFSVSMTAFVTPRLLGGARIKLMSTMIYQEVNAAFNWPMAAAISFILLGTILFFLLAANLATANAMNRLGGGKRA
ncbi:MAG: ABC transporter permease [Treponemataceae bacterium]